MKNIIKNFISKLMIVALVLSITSPFAFMADAPQGTVFISTNSLDSAYSIQKLDGTLVASGAGVAEIQFDIPASDGLGTGYKIVFSAVTGYLTPDTYYFNLSTGSTLHFGPTQDAPNNAGSYTPINQGNNAGTVFVYTNLLSSSYSLYKLDDTLVGKGNGVEPTQFDLPAQTGVGTGYKIVFDSVAGYISPSPNPFTFNLVAGDNFVLGPDQVAPYLTGLYTPEDSAGNIQINVQNELAQPIIDGSWTLYTCASASDLSSCATPYLSGTQTTSLPKVPAGIYGLKFSVTTGYSAAIVLSLNPQTLATSGALTFTLQYTTAVNVGDVEVNQFAANGILKLYGGTPATISNAIYKEPASLTGPYTLAIASMPSGGGYVLDYVTDGTGKMMTAPYTQTLIEKGKIVFNVKYKVIGDTGTVTVNQTGTTGGTTGSLQLNGPTSAAITTADYINSTSGAGSYSLTGVTPPNGYVVDTITNESGATLTAPYTQTLAKNGNIKYTVTYKAIGDTNTITVNQIGAVGAVSLTGPSPATVTTDTYTNPYAGVGDYTLTGITPPAGFVLDKVTDFSGTTLTAPYTQTLGSNEGNEVTYNVYYIPANTGTIQINVVDDAGTPVTNGSWILAGGVAPSTGTGTQTLIRNAGSYTLTASIPVVSAPRLAYTSFAITPSVTQTLTAGGTTTYTLTYTRPATSGTVKINVVDNLGAQISDGSWTLTGGSAPAMGAATDTLTLANGSYTLIAVVPAGNTTYSGVTVAPVGAQTLTSAAPLTFTVTYTRISGANIDLDITSFALAAASPAPIAGATVTYEINYKNLDTVNTATGVKIDIDYDQAHGTIIVPTGCTDNTPSAGIMRCNVTDLAPGATGLLPVLFTINAGLPIGTSMVQTATISSASPDSNLTNNTASVTTLVAGALTLTKTVSAASIADNTLVTYTIKLKRNTSAPGTINVTMADSFTPSDVLNGPNGGTLTYLINSGTCTGVTCSGQNINDAPISVALDSVGSEATITYQARSSNASVPLNGTSVVTNTVTATDNANILQPLTSQATVTIVGNSGGGGGGGGSTDNGGGGGHKIYRGDLALRIEKMVSTDGSKYTAYDENDMSVAIQEHKTTTLYTKVRVTNLGPVSVGNIVIGHLFEQGKSDITSGAISDVSGGTIKNNNLTIDKITVGGSYELSYKSDLTESASNTNPAKDSLTLVGFKSMLPPTQDGYTYLGIGSKYTTYIFAGKIPADFKPDKPATIINPSTVTNPATGTGGGYSSDSLSINVQSDKASATLGETVNFTITLKNLSDGDLTNLFIDHKYDTNAFDVLEAIGATTVDSNGIHWKRPVIRPGQPITINFSLKVKSGAPVGELVRGLTNALVSQISDITPVENFIRIVSGPAVNEGEHIQLAATGPEGLMTLIFLLSILAYFGNGAIKNALYIKKKKSALAAI